MPDVLATGVDPAPVISVSGLHKAYDAAAPVLQGIDLSVQAGARVALIGANGSGKSTLLKCIIGLHPITAGTVETLGEKFARAPSTQQRVRLRRRTGFVFQQHCLVWRRSVLSNVVHGMMGAPGSWRAFCHATAPSEWRDAAIASLEDVGLAHRALDRADTLSGGQQQRVAIARALVRKPDLLIADEPAASLDPVAGRQIMDLFTRLCEQHGITLLFTSHDMDHARSFAQRIVALKDGIIHLDQEASAVGADDLANTFERADA